MHYIYIFFILIPQHPNLCFLVLWLLPHGSPEPLHSESSSFRHFEGLAPTATQDLTERITYHRGCWWCSTRLFWELMLRAHICVLLQWMVLTNRSSISEGVTASLWELACGHQLIEEFISLPSGQDNLWTPFTLQSSRWDQAETRFSLNDNLSLTSFTLLCFPHVIIAFSWENSFSKSVTPSMTLLLGN